MKPPIIIHPPRRGEIAALRDEGRENLHDLRRRQEDCAGVAEARNRRAAAEPYVNKDDFLAAALRNPINETIAAELFNPALPDCWIVSGCLVQTAWNVQTRRAVGYGIADYDVFYFDHDTSWQAEDAVIRKLQGRLTRSGIKIEVRNQARVHLWYPRKHFLPYPALQSSTRGIDRFLTKNTQVGLRRRQDGYDAPNGFNDIAGMIVRPNPGPNFSAANYQAKARRWKRLWPEITVLDAEAT